MVQPVAQSQLEPLVINHVNIYVVNGSSLVKNIDSGV